MRKKITSKAIKYVLLQSERNIEGIDWNGVSSNNNERFVDISFYVGLNYWHTEPQPQLVITSMRKYTENIKLKIKNREYLFNTDKEENITITNMTGEKITALKIDDRYSLSKNYNGNEYIVKLVDIGRVALGLTC